MDNVRLPASFKLAGVALLFACLLVQVGFGQSSSELSLQDIKNYHNEFISGEPSIFSPVQPLPSDISSLNSLKSHQDMRLNGAQNLQGMVAINTEMQRDLDYQDMLGPSSPRMNYMNIQVSGITVIAINTARGGNAIATSNVVLQPVQGAGGCLCSGQGLEDKLV
ncbi:MAG: hypothetical protein GKC10_02650 [Methanosarcinales archaeon]|nr:hypothetical protein [Methanosarcinales archaeon]